MKNLLVVLSLFFLMGGVSYETNAQSNDVRKKRTPRSKGYQIGDVATDFNLKNVNGEMISLESMENTKGYIVVFTSNVCPFAVLYQNRLIELHHKMAPKGYPVVAINSNDPEMEAGDSFEKMQLRAREKSFPFVYLQDEGQKIFPQFGATKTPHVFLLDNEMKVQYIGAIDDNAHSPEDVKTRYVENAIAALESGRLPEPNTTKAIGCSIKSKKVGGREGGRPPRGERGGPPSPDQILARMDKDKNQKVSKAEAHGPLKRDFDRLDKDEDGFLTKEELAEMKPRRRRDNQ